MASLVEGEARQNTLQFKARTDSKSLLPTYCCFVMTFLVQLHAANSGDLQLELYSVL